MGRKCSGPLASLHLGCPRDLQVESLCRQLGVMGWSPGGWAGLGSWGTFSSDAVVGASEVTQWGVRGREGV